MEMGKEDLRKIMTNGTLLFVCYFYVFTWLHRHAHHLLYSTCVIPQINHLKLASLFFAWFKATRSRHLWFIFSCWFASLSALPNSYTWVESSNFCSTKHLLIAPLPGAPCFLFFLFSIFYFFYFPLVFRSRWEQTCSSLLGTKCGDGCPSDVFHNVRRSLEASKKTTKSMETRGVRRTDEEPMFELRQPTKMFHLQQNFVVVLKP